MSNWSLNKAPGYAPDSIATQKGWETPLGEVLVAIRGLATKAGAGDIVSLTFNAASYTQGDPISVSVQFNEKVNVTAGASLVLTGNIGNVTLYAAAQSNVGKVVFDKQVDNVTPAVLATGYATGTLTSTGVTPTNGDTVTLGAKTYTFQTTLTNVDGNVAIGANAAAALQNLKDAINLTGTPGTQYATAMTLHPTILATANNATTVSVRAKTSGTGGNSLASTETAVTLSFGGATLSGGVAVNSTLSIGAQTIGGTVLDANSAVAAVGTLTLSANAGNTETVTLASKVYTFQTTLTNSDGNVKIGATKEESAANLAAAINLSGTAGVQYAAAMTLHPSVSASVADNVMTVTAKTAGTAGNSIASTETLASGAFGGATLAGGSAGQATTLTVSAGLGTAAGARAVA